MLNSFKIKFLVSLQSSGRRWLCNVIGHYDALIRGNDPTGEEGTGCSNPLAFYGTEERWNLIPTHCANKIGGDIVVPKMFGFRPAVVLIRHPAKVAFSHFRALKKNHPDIDYSIEEYLDKVFADFYVAYANKVYKHIGQKNRIFVSYADLLAEEKLENQPSWESVIKFIFGDVQQDLLKKAVDNNSAQKGSSANAKKYIRRTPPNKLNELYDEERVILECLKPKLSAELRPSIAEYFKENKLL